LRPGGPQPVILPQLQPQGHIGRGMAAVLLVVLLPGAQHQIESGQAALVLGKGGPVVAGFHRPPGTVGVDVGGYHLVLVVIVANSGEMAVADGDIVLPEQLFTGSAKVPGVAPGHPIVVVAVVAGAPQGNLGEPGVGDRQTGLVVDILQARIAVGTLVGREGAVVGVAVVAFEKTQAQIEAAGESVACAGVDGLVAIAVPVTVEAGIVHLVVDPVGIQVGAVYAIAEAALATTGANGHLAQVVAAHSGAGVTAHRPRTVAGEYLNNPADGLAAVEAGTCAPHHFDALDLVRVEILEAGAAEGGAADALAIQKNQRVAAGGAPGVKAGDGAGPAAAVDVETRGLSEQLRQIQRLAGVQQVAGYGRHRGQGIHHRNGGAGGGNHHFPVVGGTGNHWLQGDQAQGAQHNRCYGVGMFHNTSSIEWLKTRIEGGG